MQPENQQQSPAPFEQSPAPQSANQGGERVPSLPPLETGLERGQERHEQAAEAGARAADAAAHAVPSAPVVVPAAQPDPAADASRPAASTNPLVAADDDLIEKEWVDRAKQILDQTKDDPRARSEQVNQLQRDYLQKRYGKVVGAAE